MQKLKTSWRNVRSIFIFLTLSTLISCGPAEDSATPNTECPEWTFTSNSIELFGNIGTITQIEGRTIFHFDQHPTQDEVIAGSLVLEREVNLNKNIQSEPFALQIIKDQLIFTTPTSTSATINTIEKLSTLMHGKISGKIIKTDNQNITNDQEDFELSFKIMPPNVEVPSICYEPNKKTCTCTTKCYIFENEENCMHSNHSGSKGKGTGKTRAAACNNAKKDAQSNHPKGCRNKHCQPCKCDDWCK